MTIKEISEPIAHHLKDFEKYFKSQMKSNVSLLDLIIRYMTQKKGKQVRPTMVFLSAQACGGVTDRAYVGAAMVELLHTATLIHDDVVDQSSERRGIATINAEWNNKIAVLVGDFLLSRGLLTAADNNEIEFLRITSRAVRRMSEGELLQIQKSKDFNVDEETYFRIIADKTASLLATCCEVGAASSTGDTKIREALKDYGENVGIAFQIRDDIFDFGGDKKIGKPIGNDLKEKKLTLPLLYSFARVSKKSSKEVLKIIKKGDLSTENIGKVSAFVYENGGIDYSEKTARSYASKALERIEFLPGSEAKTSLMNFANFVIDRDF